MPHERARLGGTAAYRLTACPHRDSFARVYAPRPTDWVPCRSCASELEAHIAAAVLDAAGIPAAIRGNDTAGLFGAGFQGTSARGVWLLVPRAALAAARTVLAQPRGAPDDEAPDDGGSHDDGPDRDTFDQGAAGDRWA